MSTSVILIKASPSILRRIYYGDGVFQLFEDSKILEVFRPLVHEDISPLAMDLAASIAKPILSTLKDSLQVTCRASIAHQDHLFNWGKRKDTDRLKITTQVATQAGQLVAAFVTTGNFGVKEYLRSMMNLGSQDVRMVDDSQIDKGNLWFLGDFSSNIISEMTLLLQKFESWPIELFIAQVGHLHSTVHVKISDSSTDNITTFRARSAAEADKEYWTKLYVEMFARAAAAPFINQEE